jgi:hypothetical protein
MAADCKSTHIESPWWPLLNLFEWRIVTAQYAVDVFYVLAVIALRNRTIIVRIHYFHSFYYVCYISSGNRSFSLPAVFVKVTDCEMEVWGLISSLYHRVPVGYRR